MVLQNIRSIIQIGKRRVLLDLPKNLRVSPGPARSAKPTSPTTNHHYISANLPLHRNPFHPTIISLQTHTLDFSGSSSLSQESFSRCVLFFLNAQHSCFPTVQFVGLFFSSFFLLGDLDMKRQTGSGCFDFELRKTNVFMGFTLECLIWLSFLIA